MSGMQPYSYAHVAVGQHALDDAALPLRALVGEDLALKIVEAGHTPDPVMAEVDETDITTSAALPDYRPGMVRFIRTGG